MNVTKVVLNDVIKDENLAKQYLEQIRTDLLKLLENAPKYGSCGITVTFHGGEITKINRQLEDTKIKGKDNG